MPADPTAPRPAGRRDQKSTASGSVWSRADGQKPERLTLETILSTAIGLADAEGLDAVSVRRIATVLNTRPMNMYTHVARMEDLVELMIDKIMAEIILETLPAEWREALLAIARRTREVALRHPWLMVAFGKYSALGPNAARHAEQSLTAIAGLHLDSHRAISLLRAVDVYTIGYGTVALAELQVRQRDKIGESEWRASVEGYVARLTSGGDFPRLAATGGSEVLRRGDESSAFEEGLSWLLAGFASTL